jgi:serine/threonine protein kinase
VRRFFFNSKNEKFIFFFYFFISKGGELFDRISNQTTLTEREAANVIKQVLEVLRFANKNNIAHRDLKPENIMID